MASISIEIRYSDRPAEVHEFNQPKISIGRESGNIVLGDPSCSGRHAEINLTGTHVTYVDLNSTNGSFASDGQRISAPTPLTPGSEIRIGACTLVLLKFEGGGGQKRVGAKGTQIMEQVPEGGPPSPAGPPAPVPMTPAGVQPSQAPAGGIAFDDTVNPAGVQSPFQGGGPAHPGAPPTGPGQPGMPVGAPPLQAGAPPPGAPPQGAPYPGVAPPAGAPQGMPPGAPAPLGVPPGGAPPQFGAPPPTGPGQPGMPPGAPQGMPPGAPPQGMPAGAPPQYGAPPPAGPGQPGMPAGANPYAAPIVAGAAAAGVAAGNGSADPGAFLSSAIEAYKPHFIEATKVLGIVALPLGLMNAVSSFIPVVGLVLSLIGGLGFWLIMILAGYGAVAEFALRLNAGAPITAAQAWKIQLKRAVPFFFGILVPAIIAMIGTLFCVVPGILLGFFMLPVYMVEKDKKMIDVNKRSFELVMKEVMMVVVVICVAIGLGLVNGIVTFVLGILPYIGGPMAALWAPLFTAILTPFMSFLTFRLYFDARRRLEGGDAASAAQAQFEPV